MISSVLPERRTVAKPEHRLAAASQRSLQVCIASLPLQSSWMSKTYLKSDHFNGGGSPAGAIPLADHRHRLVKLARRSIGVLWRSNRLAVPQLRLIPLSHTPSQRQHLRV